LNDRSTRESNREERPLIAVVGPCASGKSTLVKALQERGYDAHEVTQEHSYVPTMWQRITQPDLLIYLDVSQKVASQRRASESHVAWWSKSEQRLQHARQHADLCIQTDNLCSQQVLSQALAFLQHKRG
jgi:deoxyadenosine/deoxycytidine kinase